MKNPLMNRLGGIYELEGGHQNRVLSMEGLRGFAVALVFLVHYHTLFILWVSDGSLTLTISTFLRSIGHSGVDLFFVLSGYLIYGAAIKKAINYHKFMVRRVRRIYPTFLAVFMIYLALSFVFPSESKLPANMFNSIIYVIQNLLLLPGIFPIEPIITVAWSLSYEIFYYLALPLIVMGFGMQRWQPRRRVWFFVLLAIVYTIFCVLVTPRHSRLLMFISGILLFEAIHSFEIWRTLPRWAEWITVGATLIMFPIIYILDKHPEWLPSQFGFITYGETIYRIVILFLIFGLLVLACFRSQSILQRIFTWTPLRWLGNMSYSYYLIHGLVLKFIELVLKRIIPQRPTTPLLFWGLMPFAFAATLIGSTLLFMLVEKRFSLAVRRQPREKEVLNV